MKGTAPGAARDPAVPVSRPSEVPAGPERLGLDNGLTVILREHGAADVAAVQLWVGVGAQHEVVGEAGVSHFVEHLLFKGTPSRGPGVIDLTISSLGGEMNAATGQDFTYYHVVLPARHVGTALDILADAAQHAAFDHEEIERERLVVREEIRRAEDSPPACLWRLLARHHFAGHPYERPVLGSLESVGGVSREATVAHWRRHYVPNNAAVVVVGRLDRARTLEHVRAAFGGWEPHPVANLHGRRADPLATVVRAEELRSLQQTYVGLAWSGPVAPQPDVYAVDLLVSILGRGRASRLSQGLRERLGLVSSIAASFYSQRDASTIMVTARTTQARWPGVESAVLAEAARLRAELVTEDELARARTAVEAAHAFAHETAEGLAYAYGSAETVWTLDFELGYLDRLREITREGIRETARRYLSPDRFTTAVLRPKDGAG